MKESLNFSIAIFRKIISLGEREMSKYDSRDVHHKNLQIIYEQYWLHARHVANERLWFTNIYVLIVASAFAFIATSQSTVIHLWLLVFLLILSIMGFFMCHSLVIHFITYSRMTELISINEWNIPYRVYFLPEGEQRIVSKIGLNFAFYFLYMVMSSIFTCLLVYNLGMFSISITVAIAMFIALFAVYELVFKRTENRLETKLKERINV